MTAPRGAVLLTGATGFVGRNLWPALVAAGHAVRGLSRQPERARARFPDRAFVAGDVSDGSDAGGEAMVRALDGCSAALYLVHGMAEGHGDYRRSEVDAARRFAEAAARAGLERIVYLGGVAPAGEPSEHLRSRLEVGEVLRAGAVPTVELRSSMIIGHGSVSWLMVRDLAARLPFMVLPRWMSSRTEPVALDDVITALVRALSLPLPDGRSACFDLPGPQVLSGRETLERTARALRLPRPLMIPVPLLSPRLSSHWVRLVTRAEWSVARELVLGLERDLLARSDEFWRLVGHPERVPFDEAAARALDEEARDVRPGRRQDQRAGYGAAVGSWERLRFRLRPRQPRPAGSPS